MELLGKNVLITGSSGGIGGSIAKAFAEKGSKIVIHARNNTSLATIEDELRGSGFDFLSVTADFTKEDEISNMFATIRGKYKCLDVLVNVSGIERTYMDPLDTKKWKEVLDVNLFGAIECSREFLKTCNGNGVIVNISSVAGKPGVAYYGDALSYALSKSALTSFTENLAVMVAPRVRVVSISPGYTLTPMWNFADKTEMNKYSNQVPLKRFVLPSEVAKAVVSVCENDAITGTDIAVDAGLSLRELK